MAYAVQSFAVDQVLTASHMNQVEHNIATHVHGQAGVSALSFENPILRTRGDGSDGALVVNSNATVAPGMYNYTTLQVNSGKTLTVSYGVAGSYYFARCSSQLIIEGTLSVAGLGMPGAPRNTETTGIAGMGCMYSTNSVTVGLPNNASINHPLNYGLCVGGSGGGGGGFGGGSGYGGAVLNVPGGADSAAGSTLAVPLRTLVFALFAAAPTTGGAGGGSGVNNSMAGGAGGKGGGLVVLTAPIMTFTGAINASGIAGANGETGGPAVGGGGGGGGGVVITAVASYATNTGSINVAGGAGGGGNGGGNNGGAGGAGWGSQLTL